MSVYLSLGRDKTGGFQHINDQKSGRVKLTCPFCSCPLIAVKGRVKQSHFRHDGETCNESLTQLPTIPAWDHFHLNYPLEVIEILKDGYKPECQYPTVYKPQKKSFMRYGHHIKDQLLELDSFTGNTVFSKVSKIILGIMPLLSFENWMRETLKNRIAELQHDVDQGNKHRAWLEIEASRQQAILSASLYLFEFTLEDKIVVHKIGRTTRSAIDRLKETAADLAKATGKKVVKSEVLRFANNCGHVEKYALHRYSNFALVIGSHTEYLAIDAKKLKALKAEFTKLSNNFQPFEKAEKFIVTGRWKYEEKRLAASKRGITLTLREHGKFGRPKGTVLDKHDFLVKHSDIVEALERGCSINEVAKLTDKGRSTVKRVKAALEN